MNSLTTFSNTDFVEGKYAYNFNGATYLRFGVDNAFLETAYSARTYSLWIKPSNLTGIKLLFEQGGSTVCMAARLDNNLLSAAYRVANVQYTTGNLTFPADGAWHHVAVVFNSGTLTTYLDGVASTSASSAQTSIPANTGNDAIGGRNSTDAYGHSAANYFAGKMDDLRIFDAAFSAQKIADLARNDGDRLNLAAGTYSVTATSANGCSTIEAIQMAVPCPAEICSNGMDDDGDGLVDCDDPDCNVVTNGEFNSGTTDWTLFSQSGNAAVLAIDNTSQLSGANSAKMDIVTASGTDWHIQFVQAGKSIVAGKRYTVSFEAKAAADRSMSVMLQRTGPPYFYYWLTDVPLTTTKQTYSYDFQVDSTNIGQVGLFFNLGASAADVWIDNIAFKETCNAPAACTGSILANPGFESGFAGWTVNGVGGNLSGIAHSGSRALVVSASDAGMYQQFAVTPGEVYKLSCYAKAVGTLTWAGVGLIWYDASWNRLDEVVIDHSYLSSNYKSVEMVDEVPPGAVHGEVFVWRAAGGTG